MVLVSCRNLKKSFADLEVLNNVDLDIQDNERIGLVGPNGAGKSTLANIIFGELKADSGQVLTYNPHFRIGYLLQSKRYKLNDFYTEKLNSEQNSQFYTVTKSLGLKKVQNWQQERFSGLSGGEKTKLALAEIWSHRPDFLILDEPTNHLDFQGIDWLIKELLSFKGTTLIISHDRYFLDQTVGRIVEIEDGVSKNFAGNYTFYRNEKARQHKNQLHHFMDQQNKQKKVELEIKRLKNWSAKAHRDAKKTAAKNGVMKGGKEFYRSKAKKMDQAIKSRIKRLEKMKETAAKKPKDEPKVSFNFQDAKRHGRRILEAVEITKGYGDRNLFKNSSFCLQRGERVGLLGPNGCGKTTLVKLILGSAELDRGEIWISPSARIGYLAQDLDEINSELTVLQILGLDGYTFIGTARKVLANLRIDANKINHQMNELSVGEQIRVQLAKLIINQSDLLILDEPTNHLDLFNREELEDALTTYEGTLMVISHDRYMLEKLCDKLLVFTDEDIKKIEGGFSIYQEKQNCSHINREKTKEELMVIGNRLTVVLNELAKLSPEAEEYQILDQEFKTLIQQKRELKKRLDSNK